MESQEQSQTEISLHDLKVLRLKMMVSRIKAKIYSDQCGRKYETDNTLSEMAADKLRYHCIGLGIEMAIDMLDEVIHGPTSESKAGSTKEVGPDSSADPKRSDTT